MVKKIPVAHHSSKSAPDADLFRNAITTACLFLKKIANENPYL